MASMLGNQSLKAAGTEDGIGLFRRGAFRAARSPPF
jgi:hypothetical protein